MNGRERVIRALNFEQPDRVPRNLWALPGVVNGRSEEHQAILQQYPDDFQFVGVTYQPAHRVKGDPVAVGTYTDEWGAVWENLEAGIVGEVKQAALPDWAHMDSYQPPFEVFDGATVDNANRICDTTDKFRLITSMIRPFERLQFIRGTEQLYMDLAYGGSEIERLITMVHEFNLRDLQLMLTINGDCVYWGDDWGSQSALLISPSMWRDIFKPMYKEYCDMAHAAGKFVFMHSDGYIADIYPDLIEIGVNAINSQVFCMDMEQLGRDYGGKITFWGEIDRQHLLPFGTPDQVRDAVRRARLALDHGQGGVIAQCEWGLRDPQANIAAMYDEWTQPHPDPQRRYPAEQ